MLDIRLLHRIQSKALSLPLLRDQIVQPPGRLFRGERGFLVRSGDDVHPVHGPGRAFVVSERAEKLSCQIEFVDFSHAAGTNKLHFSGPVWVRQKEGIDSECAVIRVLSSERQVPL
jgi:hypothetical protein